MKKIFTLSMVVMTMLVGCGVDQEEHDTLQADYNELEETAKNQEIEIQELTETNESLTEAKALYDQNEEIINDANKRDELQQDIGKKENQLEELEVKLDELQGNIAAEEEEIEKEKEEGVTLTDDDIIKINYIGMSGSTVELSVENKTDSPYELDFNYIVINGQNYSEIYSLDTIAPNSNATIKMEIPGYSNNEEVTSIGGRGELYSVENFSPIQSFEFNDVNIRI